MFRNALIVPGTPAWRKSVLPAEGRKGRTAPEVEQHRRQKYGQRIAATANVNMDTGVEFTANTPVFPPQYKRPDDLRPDLDTAQSKANLMQTARYIAKNTAFCFYNSAAPVYKY